jgi:hypothetical protein
MVPCSELTCLASYVALASTLRLKLAYGLEGVVGMSASQCRYWRPLDTSRLYRSLWNFSWLMWISELPCPQLNDETRVGRRAHTVDEPRSTCSGCPDYCSDSYKVLDKTALTREWSGWSSRNITWNFAPLQSPSSNDCTQNCSCFYAAQGCEKIAQSWNVQFKFAQLRTRMTAMCLAAGAVFAGAFELTAWARPW